MKEILFRGKRVDNGEWAFGNFIEDKWGDDNGNTVYAILQDRVAPDIAKLWTPVRVIPETVEQYTGLKDKNGKKIFEGDIVREWSHWHKNLSATVSDIGCYLVVCDYLGSLSLKKNTSCGGVSTPLIRTSIVEVIGNIHDNPELLEVEE